MNQSKKNHAIGLIVTALIMVLLAFLTYFLTDTIYIRSASLL